MRRDSVLEVVTDKRTFVLCALMVASACSEAREGTGSKIVGPFNAATPIEVRFYHNPYSDVDWKADVALKTQLHDHVGSLTNGLRAYDKAGYDVMSLMQYSGVASLPYAWHERHWPLEAWVDSALRKSLVNIKLFIPNGEEVGYFHVTSPFLTTYIAKFEPAYYPGRESWHYGGPDFEWIAGTQDEVSTVARFGGFPILAHPYADWSNYRDLQGYGALEVYSAYATYKQFEGIDPFFSTDRNAVMVANWDSALTSNDRVIGVAVNDHFGPDNTTAPARIRDSGKVIVVAHRLEYAAFRDAFLRGALFAVKDIGEIKDQFPIISSIRVSDDEIAIDTMDSVTWISGGVKVGAGSKIAIRSLPFEARYVRAEVTNADGSTTYTQAFTIRRVGDTNGDGSVDGKDKSVCDDVWSGQDNSTDEIAACAAVLAVRDP
jgi:hypothetical protein